MGGRLSRQPAPPAERHETSGFGDDGGDEELVIDVFSPGPTQLMKPAGDGAYATTPRGQRLTRSADKVCVCGARARAQRRPRAPAPGTALTSGPCRAQATQVEETADSPRLAAALRRQQQAQGGGVGHEVEDWRLPAQRENGMPMQPEDRALQAPLVPPLLTDAQVDRVLRAFGAAAAPAGEGAGAGAPAGRQQRAGAAEKKDELWIPSDIGRSTAEHLAAQQLENLKLRAALAALQAEHRQVSSALAVAVTSSAAPGGRAKRSAGPDDDESQSPPKKPAR